jgi:plasmid replication initiation protein
VRGERKTDRARKQSRPRIVEKRRGRDEEGGRNCKMGSGVEIKMGRVGIVKRAREMRYRNAEASYVSLVREMETVTNLNATWKRERDVKG